MTATSALDPEFAQEVVAVLRQLASEDTMLIATHDLRLAAQIGRVIFPGGRGGGGGGQCARCSPPQAGAYLQAISTLWNWLPEAGSI